MARRPSLTPPSPAIYSPAPISSTSPSVWHTAPSTLASAIHNSAPPTEIAPRIYISDLAAAESAPTLSALGITHVVSAMPGRIMLPPHLALQSIQLPVHDSPFAELAALLPAATAFVLDALRDPAARVLVHCAQGISRSASVVCAVLIRQHGWSPERALQVVKARWPQADPNPGFVAQLGEYARSLAPPDPRQP